MSKRVVLAMSGGVDSSAAATPGTATGIRSDWFVHAFRHD